MCNFKSTHPNIWSNTFFSHFVSKPNSIWYCKLWTKFYTKVWINRLQKNCLRGATTQNSTPRCDFRTLSRSSSPNFQFLHMPYYITYIININVYLFVFKICKFFFYMTNYFEYLVKMENVSMWLQVSGHLWQWKCVVITT